MKKSILSLSLAVLSVLLICSCKDDDEVVLSTDCYISSFTLGNVKRQITTVNSAGRDTTYTISYSALYFPMTVNQLDGTIANKDSLPVNSDVKAVLATVESSGTVVYKKVSEGDDAWKAYSTSDSIDFTSPLTFQHTATGTEPVRPFLSGKLLQLVLQYLFIINGFPQLLFAFLQLPVELFQL